MYQIIQKRKIWLSISGLMVGLSILSLILWGLNYGIDFTGGSLLEVKFNKERPTVGQIQEAVSGLDLGSLVVQPVGNNGAILRFQDTSEEKHQEALAKLGAIYGSQDSATADNMNATGTPASANATGTEALSQEEIENPSSGSPAVEELRFDSVGPSIGQELKNKSITSTIVVLIAIALYIAWAFRKVSKPVASWKYGIAAIIALFHDVLITLGVFAILGKYYGIEVNTPFVAAILTVLGYSVNDTIVVFDRVRENLPKSESDFESTVNESVNQTITRSINTSATTLLVLISILIFGGASIRDFVLALAIGVFVGTYSSIFLASPVLVLWERWRSE